MKQRLHSVLVTVAVSLIGHLSTAVMSPSQETFLLQDDYQYSSQILPYLRLIMIASFGVTAALSGVLVGRFGPQVVSLLGGVVITIGLLTTVFISSACKCHMFITYGVITGGGCGLVYVGIYEAVKLMCTANRNFVYGVMGCVSYLGYYLGPYVFNHLLIDYPWRGALLIMTAVVMNIIPLSLLLPGGSGPQHPIYQAFQEFFKTAGWKNRHFGRSRHKHGINDTALASCNSEDLEIWWESERNTRAGEQISKPKVTRVLRKTGIYALIFAGVLYSYGVSVVLGTIGSYIEHHGLSYTNPKVLLFIISGVCVCIFMVCQGVIITRLEPVYWYIGCACVGGLLTFIFIIPVPLLVIYVYVGLLGVSIAGTGREIISPVIINLTGADNFALPFGIYVCMTSFARLLGCPVTTVWVFEKSQSFKPVFAMAAVTMSLAAVICFLMRRKLKRRSIRERIITRRVTSQDDSWIELVTSV